MADRFIIFCFGLALAYIIMHAEAEQARLYLEAVNEVLK